MRISPAGGWSPASPPWAASAFQVGPLANFTPALSARAGPRTMSTSHSPASPGDRHGAAEPAPSTDRPLRRRPAAAGRRCRRRQSVPCLERHPSADSPRGDLPQTGRPRAARDHADGHHVEHGRPSVAMPVVTCAGAARNVFPQVLQRHPLHLDARVGPRTRGRVPMHLIMWPLLTPTGHPICRPRPGSRRRPGEQQRQAGLRNFMGMASIFRVAMPSRTRFDPKKKLMHHER